MPADTFINLIVLMRENDFVKTLMIFFNINKIY